MHGARTMVVFPILSIPCYQPSFLPRASVDDMRHIPISWYDLACLDISVQYHSPVDASRSYQIMIDVGLLVMPWEFVCGTLVIVLRCLCLPYSSCRRLCACRPISRPQGRMEMVECVAYVTDASSLRTKLGPPHTKNNHQTKYCEHQHFHHGRYIERGDDSQPQGSCFKALS